MDPDLGRYPVVGPRPACRRRSSGPAGDAADPVQRDGRADRRGPRADVDRRGRPCAAVGSDRRPDPARAPAVSRTEPRNATVTYPGGLRARWRWGGSGQRPAVFALSEAGGTLIDLARGSAPIPTPCAGPSSGSRDRAAPGRPASPRLIHDEPRGAATGTRRAAGRRLRLPHVRPRGRDRRGPLGAPVGDARSSRCSASPRLAHVARPVRDRDVRDRAGRDRRLAGRPLATS